MDQSIFSLFTTKDWPFKSQSKNFNESNQKDSSQNLLRSRQDTIDGMLFLDRLMQLGSISNFKDLYPPSHPSRLRQLLDSIDACKFDLLKKNCLVYYLLKEYRDGRETRFAIDRLIPTHFTRGVDGLWALDHSDWKAAIRSMSHPTVTPDFLPEIIRTLATQPHIQLRAHYLMRFYQLVQPSLNLESIVFVIRAMCVNRHLRSAWALQRSYGPKERTRLIRIVFETCFGLNDFLQPLSDSLQLLIAFPFDQLEDSILLRFALDAPKLLSESHSMVVIHFYLSKLTSEARYVEAIRFERALSESNQIDSNPDIDRIIRGIVEILPEVQRNMLELEFDQQHPLLNQIQISPGKDQNASDEMELSTSYDVRSLAWDPPPSPPSFPPPSSLAEARNQQELLIPPKKSIDRASLPLSASPIFRRAMPRMSLDKSNMPQKVLLKALAYTRQSSAPNSPNLNESPQPQINQPDDHQDDSILISPPASSRPTPRFQHFVGPSSRLPPSATKPPPPPNFSTSFSRSTVTTTGSPFHRLSFPDQSASDKLSPKSVEERWPTRIVFTPRRPPSQTQRKPEERSMVSRQPINRSSSAIARQNQRNQKEHMPARISKPVDEGNNNSSSSRSRSSNSNDDKNNDDSEEEEKEKEEKRVAVLNQKPSAVKQFTAVVVPIKGVNKHRETRSSPKTMSKMSDSFEDNTKSIPKRMDKVLPGGFEIDDEEMEGRSHEEKQIRDQNENQSQETSKISNTYRSSNSRKKFKVNNDNHQSQNNSTKNGSMMNVAAPITPRRSTRLHSSTPAKPSKLTFPGGMVDTDLTEDEEEDFLKSTQENDEKLSGRQLSTTVNTNKKNTSVHNKSRRKVTRN